MKTIVRDLKSLLVQKLNYLTQKQFTGLFVIKSDQKEITWEIYFCLGKIVWVESNYHFHRSWLRALAKNCPEIKLNETFISGAKKYQCWRYRILTALCQKQKITQEQFRVIIKTLVAENLFDIFQQSQTERLEYLTKNTSANYLLDCGLKISFINLDRLLSNIEKQHQSWLKCCHNQFDCLSPNLAPRLKDLNQLKKTVSQDIYERFVEFIDGQTTLRDLAIKIDRDLQLLTCSLIPYIQQGLLEFLEIPDLPEQAISWNLSKNSANFSRSKPLIICIDDSPQILKTMSQIIMKQGCRFLGIQESLRAIPSLITHKPDLIFLDVGMPVVNGYEICQQLRRTSQLKEIPVILLTGQDTMIDRVKAKIAGTSQFLTKPIDMSQIINVIELTIPKEART